MTHEATSGGSPAGHNPDLTLSLTHAFHSTPQALSLATSVWSKEAPGP